MATIPMLILWLGIGEASKIAIIVLATFFPVFLNTVEGISRYDEGLVDVARCFGYTPTQTLRRVVIPGAIPYILTGMRLGLGYGWRSLIASELLAASSGLGYMILNAEQSNRVTLCPLASAASIKAFVMARLFPFFLGLPVMTTIFLPIAMPPVFPKLTFFKAHITIIFRMMFITSTHIEV